MMQNRLDQELDVLLNSLNHMGNLCTDGISEALEALLEGNQKKAQAVVETSQLIRRDEREVENTCLRLLLQQQPVAKDLRMVSAALKSVYDLERIGIVTGDIAEIILKENVTAANDILGLRDMTQHAKDMVTDAVDALVHRDSGLAETVIRNDDYVDASFIRAKQILVEKFTKDSNVEYALNLLMIAKYIEKIGDHAVNVAEWAVFAASGVRPGES